MPLVAFSTTKTMRWYGVDERFSNVYVYDMPTVTDENAMLLATQIINTESQVHATSINYVETRAWTTGGTPQENETIFIRDENETGDQPPEPLWFRPAAFLLSWRTGRPSIRDRPVYLHKWFHSLSLLGAADNSWISGAEPIPTATTLDLLTQIGANLTSIELPDGSVNELASNSGRKPLNAVPAITPFLEYHELRY